MTRSPQINEVLQYARDRADGRTAPELRPALDQAEQMLTQMKMIFEAQLRFRERTSVLQDQLPRVQAAFERLAQAVLELGQGSFRVGADGLEHAFNDLMASMDALKTEEEAWPTYSRSPYMNVLMRLAHGAARGGITPAALDRGLSEMLTQHERMATTLDVSAHPGREAALFAERRDDIHRHFALIIRKLKEARQALSEGRVSDIPAILERACTATDALAAVQDEFEQAEQSRRHRPCFRCGTTNERTNSHCTKCGGMLPPMPVEDVEAAAVDVTLEEGRLKARGHVQTELTHKLQQAALQVRQGKITHEAFTQVLDEAAQRLAKARGDFGKLPLHLPPDAPPEVAEFLGQAGEQMRTAFDEFDEGLQRMRAWLVDENPATLDFGLEAALTGGDKLAAFQAFAQVAPS